MRFLLRRRPTAPAMLRWQGSGELPPPLAAVAAQRAVQARASLLPTLGLLPQPWLLCAIPPSWDDAVAARRCGGAIARTLLDAQLEALALPLAELPDDERVLPFLIGLAQGGYAWDRYLPKPAPRLAAVELIGSGSGAWRTRLARAQALAEAIARCRDLVNAPAEELGPAEFVAAARAWLSATPARLAVHGEAACRRLRLGCLLAVGRASPRRPCMLELRLAGRDRDAPPIAVVGKGVCFDTGGLNLKGAEAMALMRKDMAGAATVLAALAALARLGPPRRTVRAWLPLADNAIAGAAYRPGDVLRAADGTSIEVGNTDAEGRLLLADAVCLARRARPSAIISVASLTGAALTALGRIHVPLIATDDALAERLLDAARASGEKLWRLPLDDDYRALNRGQAAELTNAPAGGEAGCIAAGAFIAHFARGTPFAHLDISPASWQPKAGSHGPAGATGVMVSTLVEALCE